MTVEFFERYKHKVKTLDELFQTVGEFPRQEKIIICHGVFDVVHPGHIRHLAFAKSKADRLIVSITDDKHINKGTYRPHIPADLRALNLAAFEMVDYVVVDLEAKPLSLIKKIKPDFFAKGFEYTSSGLPPATQEELELVEGYGGEMVFTPGDVVYSSSNFLASSLPDVKLEKLLLLMKSNGLTFDSLRETLEQPQKFKVHVVGDTIVDTYTRTKFIGGQTKTPTFSVLYESHEDYVGGAGIVSQHLKAAGADVVFSTVLGEDKLKDFVISLLTESGINVKAVIDPSRPTTNKNAIISGEQRLLKLDTLDNKAISNDLVLKIKNQILEEKCHAIVFSDFRHGLFNNNSVPVLTNDLPLDVFKVADSQVASRWGNISDFKNFDLITPNEREARFVLADQDSTASSLADSVLKLCQSNNLILKLGEHGILALSKEANGASFSIDSFATHVKDPVGAGDALLAYATVSFLKTNSLVISGILGVLAASCECELDGNKPILIKQVLEKIDALEQSASYLSGGAAL